MAVDEALLERLRAAMKRRRGITEKRMFGSVAFLHNGNMVCGPVKGKLMVRVGPEAYSAALSKPDVTEMDFTGRPMRGYVFVLPAGMEDAAQLKYWIEAGLKFVRTLPPK